MWDRMCCAASRESLDLVNKVSLWNMGDGFTYDIESWQDILMRTGTLEYVCTFTWNWKLRHWCVYNGNLNQILIKENINGSQSIYLLRNHIQHYFYISKSVLNTCQYNLNRQPQEKGRVDQNKGIGPCLFRGQTSSTVGRIRCFMAK